MPPTPEASALNRYLADLVWLIESKDLITSHFAGKPDLAFLGWTPAGFERWLNELAAHPPALLTQLANTPKTRLGFYHEALWKLLLTEAPAIDLLGHQLAIKDGKRTLGELDFLYRHRPSQQIYHLEVAIKFYLGLPDCQGPGQPQDLARWIGPAGLDSLAIKVAHSENKQLPLSDLPLARQQLELQFQQSLENRSLNKQLALPGVLYYPWSTPMPAPIRANPGSEQGWWLYFRTWPEFLASFTQAPWGALLEKPHWLAFPPASQLMHPKDLQHLLERHFQECGWPLHLALFCPTQGWQRLFLVNDDWPKQLPLPPRQD